MRRPFREVGSHRVLRCALGVRSLLIGRKGYRRRMLSGEIAAGYTLATLWLWLDSSRQARGYVERGFLCCVIGAGVNVGRHWSPRDETSFSDGPGQVKWGDRQREERGWSTLGNPALHSMHDCASSSACGRAPLTRQIRLPQTRRGGIWASHDFAGRGGATLSHFLSLAYAAERLDNSTCLGLVPFAAFCSIAVV